MLNLHEDFLIRMKQILGEDYPNFYNALQQDEQKAIYVNNNKISTEKFLSVVDFSVSPISYDKSGFYVDNEKKGRHPLHHAGAFYIQEPSAMFTVNAYNFKGNEKVLDMCAAPGGKTIQLANRIPNGILVSNEFVKSRSSILYSNVERMGLKNVIITNESPQNIAKAYANTFDVCLVDAPCSGEGMFRRGEEVTKEWNANLPKMCAQRQMEILEQADMALKQDGVLIYSTCTYSLEENEEVVKNFAKIYGYEILNIDAPFSRGVDLPKAVRLYPHVVKGEGQFVAVLKKLSENDNVSNKVMELKPCKVAAEFVKNCLDKSYNFNMEKFARKFMDFSYFVLDQSMIKKNINYISIGVKLGAEKDKRFEPDHYLFSAFGADFKLKLNLDAKNEKLLKYLKGETFETDLPDGFGAVLVCGCPVGGFKISGGKFKNHYPKGLRNFK